MKNLLISRGFKLWKDDYYIKGNIKVKEYSDHYSIDGPLLDREYNTKNLDDILKLIVCLENPLETIHNATLKCYLELSYFIETLEPVLLDYDLFNSGANLNSIINISYSHPNAQGLIRIKYNLVQDELLINKELILNKNLTTEELERYLLTKILIDEKRFGYIFDEDSRHTINTYKTVRKIEETLKGIGCHTYPTKRIVIDTNNIPKKYNELLKEFKEKCPEDYYHILN